MEDRNPAAHVGNGVGEERAGEVHVCPRRIGTEGAAHETVARRGPQRRRHGGRCDEIGGEPLCAQGARSQIGGGGCDQHDGPGAGRQDIRVVGRQPHDGHAPHGVAGQHGVVDVARGQDGGEVVGERLDGQRRRPPTAGPVAPLVVEHDTVTGFDQTAGHRDPDGVGAAPAVGEDHRWSLPDVPEGQLGTVLGLQAAQRGRLQRAPPELIEVGTRGGVPGGERRRRPVTGPRGRHLLVGDRSSHQGGGGTEGKQAATAAGDVEGCHQVRPLRRATNCWKAIGVSRWAYQPSTDSNPTGTRARSVAMALTMASPTFSGR